LMRSLNTSITALIPIASLLIIGSLILGATTLEEFALALLIGLASGAYSSIFIASPFLAIFKEREPRYRDIKRRIESKQTSRRTIREIAETEPDADGDGKEEVTVGAATTTTTTGARPVSMPGAGRMATNIPPRPRKKGKRR